LTSTKLRTCAFALFVASNSMAYVHSPAQSMRNPMSSKQCMHSRMSSVRAARIMASVDQFPVTGNNFPITDSVREYVKDKVGRSVGKYEQLVNGVDVHLTVNHNPSRKQEGHKAEVTVYAKGMVIRASQKTETMYASIDLVADTLARKLRKYKEKKQSKGSRDEVENFQTELAAVEEEEVTEEFEDAYKGAALPAGDVVKRKSFPMPSISVDDAALCLEYIDHDFYVFRNEETKEINVVYKRNSGGTGLIEPEKA